jgi:hypothetical protein
MSPDSNTNVVIAGEIGQECKLKVLRTILPFCRCGSYLATVFGLK